MYDFPPPVWTNQDWEIGRLGSIVVFGLILPLFITRLTRGKPWMATVWVIVGTLSLCAFSDYFLYAARTYEPYRYMMALPGLLLVLSASRALQIWWRSTDGAARVHEGIVIALVLIVLFNSTLPGVTTTRWTAGRQMCRNNLKMIGLAMHNYHDRWSTLPAASFGQPRVSWRIALLPYLDQKKLAERYDTTQAWDSPSNSVLQKTLVRDYSCSSRPSQLDSEGRFLTAYIVPTLTGMIFDSTTGTRFSDIPDGTSNTFLAMEACGTEIIWTEPRDVDSSNAASAVNGPGPRKGQAGSMISSWHSNGAHVAFADGSVRFINSDIHPGILHASLTKDGSENIPP